jgi:hypothetical protein
MTPKAFFLTTSAIFTLAVPAVATAAIPHHKVPAKAIHIVSKPVVVAQVQYSSPIAGPSCDSVDASYTRCVGAAWNDSLPVVVTTGAGVFTRTGLLSTLDDNTQDG